MTSSDTMRSSNCNSPCLQNACSKDMLLGISNDAAGAFTCDAVRGRNWVERCCMATTVMGAFTTFKAQLEATPLQEVKLSERHKRVLDFVSAKFTLVNNFLIGSYARDTACRPIKDVDLMIVLSWSKYGDYYGRQVGPYVLLSAIKQPLVAAYQNTIIRVDGQAVSLKFSDCTIDVVPALAMNDINVDTGDWYIPDSPGSTWIQTNPKRHAAIMTDANSRCGACLSHLSRWPRPGTATTVISSMDFTLRC